MVGRKDRGCRLVQAGAVGAVGAAPALGHTGTVGWEEGEN